MHTNNLYFKALEKKYEAQIAEATAILNTYFNSTVGIGEHSELLDEFDKHIENLANAEDKLEKLHKHFNKEQNVQGQHTNGQVKEKQTFN